MANTNPKIDLVDIVYEVTKSLCMLYRSATKGAEHDNYMDRQTISIPNYQSRKEQEDSESQEEDSKPRVSEQELRFALAAELQMRGIRYSVETPTKGKYTFTKHSKNDGKKSGGRSAQTDLTILDQALKPALNVELKYGGYSTKRKSDDGVPLQIRKDIEKLQRERPSGCYIHLFSAVNSNSARNIVNCVNESAKEMDQSNSEEIDKVDGPYVFIFIISLKQKCLICVRAEKSKLGNVSSPDIAVSGDNLEFTSASSPWKLIHITTPPRDNDFVLELPASRSNCDSNSNE